MVCCRLPLGRKFRKLYYRFVIACLVSYLLLISFGNPIKQLMRLIDHKNTKNYFLTTLAREWGNLVVNTSGCQIPDFDPWDPSIAKWYFKNPDLFLCFENNHHWTYVDGSEIVINKTALEEDSVSFSSLKCCYKRIIRVEQSLDKYDDRCDDTNNYDDPCQEMGERTTPISGQHFMVTCRQAWSLQHVFFPYVQFHSIATADDSEKTRKKFEYWKVRRNMSGENRIPSIILLGLDSTSRLNFMRNMPQTRKVMKELQAVEMFGYTKVGENTYPNIVPIVTGYSDNQYQRICHPNDYVTNDYCPFIWKRMDEASYTTAFLEDLPYWATFNHGLNPTGFVSPPVDFYGRPLQIAAYDHLFRPFIPKSNVYLDCIGYQTNDESLLAFLESVVNLTQGAQTPLFAMTWSTLLGHDDIKGLQRSDATYANFVTKLNQCGALDNSILVILGDHGYRFGEFRYSVIGFYEDKLPNMWIYLPPWIRKAYPHWQSALEVNSRQLTTPYFLNGMINQVLDEFTDSKRMLDEKDLVTGEVIPRNYAYDSFLRPTDESSECEDKGVPDIFCACSLIQYVDTNDVRLTQAAQWAVDHINNFLTDPEKCAKLELKSVTAGALTDKTRNRNPGRRRLIYTIAFVTSPADFLFEATVEYMTTTSQFKEKPDVQRTSSTMNTDVSCVAKDFQMQLYCFCK